MQRQRAAIKITVDGPSESYRVPMRVYQVRKIAKCYFPVCPRCNRTVEREYQSYCDRCGQALNWRKFHFK